MAPERQDSRLDDAIMATVVYADLFDFPLSPREIHRDLIHLATSPYATERALATLLTRGDLMDDRGYAVLPGRAGLAQRRLERAERAKRLWPSARRFGLAIGRFPFVRLVAVSGSLAADNPDDHADLDYMIVTVPGRLWLVRAMAVGLVRLARRQGVHLCPNYLLTTRALDLRHRDLFTAHELLQTVPVQGQRTYQELLDRNAWAACWLPNRYHAMKRDCAPYAEVTAWQRVGEAVLSSRLGDHLESWEAQRKQANLRTAASQATFNSDVCEGHFGRSRRRSMCTFEARCATMGIRIESPSLVSPGVG